MGESRRNDILRTTEAQLDSDELPFRIWSATRLCAGIQIRYYEFNMRILTNEQIQKNSY